MVLLLIVAASMFLVNWMYTPTLTGMLIEPWSGLSCATWGAAVLASAATVNDPEYGLALLPFVSVALPSRKIWTSAAATTGLVGVKRLVRPSPRTWVVRATSTPFSLMWSPFARLGASIAPFMVKYPGLVALTLLPVGRCVTTEGWTPGTSGAVVNVLM